MGPLVERDAVEFLLASAPVDASGKRGELVGGIILRLR